MCTSLMHTGRCRMQCTVGEHSGVAQRTATHRGLDTRGFLGAAGVLQRHLHDGLATGGRLAKLLGYFVELLGADVIRVIPAHDKGAWQRATAGWHSRSATEGAWRVHKRARVSRTGTTK